MAASRRAAAWRVGAAFASILAVGRAEKSCPVAGLVGGFIAAQRGAFWGGVVAIALAFAQQAAPQHHGAVAAPA